MIEASESEDGWLEITPTNLRCGIGACPAVFKTPAGSLVIVGRSLSSGERGGFLAGRIAPDETAVEIDAALVEGLTFRRDS
jgi:hypothetical protein